ncbi:hypothetical protein Slala04_29290 [Streptomyces lavendulae subsp. lavendulae]|nr:hypothetical protein Slala04_29290 [Streptomyces lavendulae subsp. lavendulae]
MTRMRLNHTVLAQRAGLGRTTVSEALSPAKPAPSPWTVEALATALNLPVEELRELQRNAAEDTGGGARAVPGRPIGEWDPHDLEVHPAGPDDAASGPGRSEARTMPGYVRREHDRVLAEVVEDAAAGRSRAVVLVGGSSTGKTRACWEAVQPRAAQGWRLWHPFAPTRAQDALEDLPRVAPRTVVWLNEAQHYLGDRAAGERIAAAVHQLLVDARRGPVLVLGTLWPEYAARYTALPVPGEPDSHSRVRELLAGRTLTVPDTFDTPALAAAAALAEGGDQLLGGALSRAGADGRVTQDLAGAPELLNRYRRATPAAAAVLEVAMDARRLGVGLHLPQAFLTDAASDYLTDTDYDYDQLTDDWAEQAFAELAALVHSKQAPLRRTSRTRLCPPASFWHAAHTHLTDPYDLGILAHEAEKRHRLQWTLSLRRPRQPRRPGRQAELFTRLWPTDWTQTAHLHLRGERPCRTERSRHVQRGTSQGCRRLRPMPESLPAPRLRAESRTAFGGLPYGETAGAAAWRSRAGRWADRARTRRGGAGCPAGQLLVRVAGRGRVPARLGHPPHRRTPI